MQTDDVISGLARTTEEIFSLEEFRSALSSGKKLRMKYGVDLTAPFLHIGHAVNLWMYRSLQELGHKVIFLLGDFTSQIGDPTGRSKTRPVLTPEEMQQNADEFLKQVRMVLLDDPQVFEVRRNSEWFSNMASGEFLSLLRHVTHDRLISRDMFRKRIAASESIYMHEMLYPVIQGYDSVVLEADLTIVGSEQLFNEMLGRFFQERMGQRPQVIMTSIVTPGTDGKEKQSKSLGNYVALAHSAREKFGRLMSIPDSLIFTYLRVYTTVPLEEIKALESDSGLHPMEAKRRLAREVVARYHGVEVSLEEDSWFMKTFSGKTIPSDASQFSVGSPGAKLLSILRLCFPEESVSELRRLLSQGAVKVEGKTVKEADTLIDIPSQGTTLKVGKRRWVTLKP